MVAAQRLRKLRSAPRPFYRLGSLWILNFTSPPLTGQQVQIGLHQTCSIYIWDRSVCHHCRRTGECPRFFISQVNASCRWSVNDWTSVEIQPKIFHARRLKILGRHCLALGQIRTSQGTFCFISIFNLKPWDSNSRFVASRRS